MINRHQRLFIYEELRRYYQVKERLNRMLLQLDRLRGDRIRLLSGRDPYENTRVDGGCGDPAEIQLFSINEQIKRMEFEIVKLEAKCKFIENALELLNNDQKYILQLEIIEKAPREQVASNLHVSPDTVKRWKAEALSRLAPMLLGPLA